MNEEFKYENLSPYELWQLEIFGDICPDHVCPLTTPDEEEQLMTTQELSYIFSQEEPQP